MTGQQLIDAIQKHNLEDLIIDDVIKGLSETFFCIEFFVSDTEFPYPEYRDKHFDEPAHLYKYKILILNNDETSECHEKELDTRK